MQRNLVKLVGLLLMAATLASCGLIEGDGRHMVPLPAGVEAKMRAIGSSRGEAVMMRLYKEEEVLEVWKRVADGSYKLLKTYEICAYSGDLGPKFKEGDRQSPEGFYTVTPGLLNPKSSYYLAFNTGFPNKFDRAHGRTGSNLMVHGDCSSRGCYAMTDQQIAEIYAIARESFTAGNKSFEFQAFPFRLTPENLARHHDSPHLAFWQNLKVGYDYFELARRPAEWDVCNGEYVFDNAGSCPVRPRDGDLARRVAAKQKADQSVFETQVAELKDKEARRLAALAEREAREQAVAERTAAVNAAVSQSTNVIGSAVGGFFGSIFGGGNAPSAPQVKAPVPAPRISRAS